jgi:hypothetical protein
VVIVDLKVMLDHLVFRADQVPKDLRDQLAIKVLLVHRGLRV